ncbi:hypothetical protein [Schlesneria sp.]|uniref:hypothetical protein n=1 Tax=Schlesneria sp. TaxID=2762018 RepID=UPI002EFE6D52
MWPPTTTPCECTEPGWCQRHHCRKPPAWHLLCRLQQEHFQAWEEGHGLYLLGDGPDGVSTQQVSSAVEDSSSETVDEGFGPGMLQRVWNFTQAVTRHVANAAREVDDTTRETRLSICRECPVCETDRMVCRHTSCGCFLPVKARWESEGCPLEKWPA